MLAYDDEATPVGLIGKKQLPILIKDDGEAICESETIILYLEHNFEPTVLLPPSELYREASPVGGTMIDQCCTDVTLAEVMPQLEYHVALLCLPRWPLAALPEFKTPVSRGCVLVSRRPQHTGLQGSIVYYNAKKEKQFEGKVTLESLLMYTHALKSDARKALDRSVSSLEACWLLILEHNCCTVTNVSGQFFTLIQVFNASSPSPGVT